METLTSLLGSRDDGVEAEVKQYRGQRGRWVESLCTSL